MCAVFGIYHQAIDCYWGAVSRGDSPQAKDKEAVMARTVGQMVAEATAVVPGVKVEDAQRRMQDDPNTLVIDVRDSAAARGERIPGAINIGYGDLLFAADNEVPQDWRDPRLQDRSRPIITHCVLGPLGAIAAKTLQDMGFTNVSYMEGGIEGWKAAGFPTEQSQNS
jgi:rhodanese-related sulfurtransferase